MITPGYKNIRDSGASIRGIGIDLVEVERVRFFVERFGGKFFQKIFSQQERIDSYRHANPYPSLAARLAAKEAMAKALGIGIGAEFLWLSSIILLDDKGKPEIGLDTLGQRKVQELGVRHIALSLTHTKNLAQAVVVLSA
ncbi:MAG: holo-ACP synthase [Puniceicoccales bacterium]|jgi:holo-[acyl-carrier protein] synthase|nr:holo-ACP synthase [Puniceicoccales bacterium]